MQDNRRIWVVVHSPCLVFFMLTFRPSIVVDVKPSDMAYMWVWHWDKTQILSAKSRSLSNLWSFSAFFMTHSTEREKRNRESNFLHPCFMPIGMVNGTVNWFPQMTWAWQSCYSILMTFTILDGIPWYHRMRHDVSLWILSKAFSRFMKLA